MINLIICLYFRFFYYGDILFISIIVVNAIKRADLITTTNRFEILLNDTFNENDFSLIPREQLFVSKDKIRASKCSINDNSEFAVYESLKKLCFLYSASFDRINFANKNG